MIKTIIFAVWAFIAMTCLPVQAESGWTFDQSTDRWEIQISLVGEEPSVLHPVDAIIIDQDEKNVTVLYPNHSRSITYDDSQVRNVVFHNKLNGNVFQVKK